MYSVITTINPPTDSVKKLSSLHAKFDLEDIVIVGDLKGPVDYDLDKCILLNIEAQNELYPSLSQLTPKNHYSRKNLGYLYAIERGADLIYETDDDNCPNEHWTPRELFLSDYRLASSPKGPIKWLNVYKYFTEEKIWPRGLPLDRINDPIPTANISPVRSKFPIQQGLANNSPDVDAIWRLINEGDFNFDDGISNIVCPEFVWTPFNTQSTWWWKEVFSLLYIPSFCSFRMCDIWKSFIAQRCLWEIDCNLIYHSPEVYQVRNTHDLTRDFEDEVPGYTRNNELVDSLQNLKLQKGREFIQSNMLECYKTLVGKNFFPKEELTLLESWFDILNRSFSK